MNYRSDFSIKSEPAQFQQEKKKKSFKELVILFASLTGHDWTLSCSVLLMFF